MEENFCVSLKFLNWIHWAWISFSILNGGFKNRINIEFEIEAWIFEYEHKKFWKNEVKWILLALNDEKWKCVDCGASKGEAERIEVEK